MPEDLEGSVDPEVSVTTPKSRVTFPEGHVTRQEAGGGAGVGVGGKGGKEQRSSSIPLDGKSVTPDFTESRGSLARGQCVVCGGPTNEFGEEVVGMCAVVVGMYCNRLPHVVPRYLVSRIIPALTK